MNKHHISAWALVVAGFAVGVMTGVAGTTHGAPSAPPQPTTLAEVFGAQERTQIIDAAAECAVYGLPGSPATLVLRTDAQGAPMSASVESDIFGGDETEECILKGISASKSVERTHRILLPTYFPDKNESIVANR